MSWTYRRSGACARACVVPRGSTEQARGSTEECLAAIVLVATSGCTWRQLPRCSGRPGPRSTGASTSGAGLGCGPGCTGSSWTNSAPAVSWTGRGARSTRSACGPQKRGPLTGPNPTGRGKNGSKIHLITDRNGLPLSLGISGANLHDSQALKPLVRGIPPIRSRRGPGRRRPARLHADKGYDYDHLRKWLSQRGIGHRIARKGIEFSARLGRHRWVVERTVSRLAGCRHPHRRYERTAEHFLAFVDLAAALIGYRRLAR
ncbi:IS5 family transposase [Streptomyces sp. NPDC052682]|uniref:IS5 family transposase n=1 Tax=Streptomyces sp. NPDC052682 TaxID=3154954 RepID=UPI00342AB46C